METEHLRIDHIKSLLNDFKYNLYTYMSIMDKLDIIAEELKFEPKSPKIKSKEEAFYKYEPKMIDKSYIMYGLLEEEKKLIFKKNAIWMLIDETLEFIKKLDQEELEIIDFIYYRKMKKTDILKKRPHWNLMYIYRVLDRVWTKI